MCCSSLKLTELINQHHQCYQACKQIGYRHTIPHPGHAKEVRQNKQTRKQNQHLPHAYQQAYYGQTQAKGTGTGFGIASLVLGILSVFTFACCINYILAVLAIIFGIVQIVKNEKKGLAIGGIITAVISIVLGIAVSLYAVNIAEKMQDPDSPFYQYFEEYEQKLEEGKSSF